MEQFRAASQAPNCRTRVWEGSASELKRILDNGGSVWDVTLGEEDENDLRRYQLTRRVAGPVVEAIEAVGSVSERAGQHLNEAWTQLLGTQPDPSAAYQAAVRARSRRRDGG